MPGAICFQLLSTSAEAMLLVPQCAFLDHRKLHRIRTDNTLSSRMKKRCNSKAQRCSSR